MYMKTVRAAQNIQKLNYQKGDIFSIVARNNHEIAPICMALLCSGYTFNGVEPSYAESEIIRMLELTKPKLVFSELQSYALVKKCLTELGNAAKIYTFCGQIGNSIAVDDLFAETGIEEQFM